MGIHDRDYYRDGSDGLFAAWGRWGTTVWLIVVTAVVFVGQILTRRPGDFLGVTGLTGLGVYDYDLIRAGEIWRLITPLFLHDPNGFMHLVGNMFVLYWVGQAVESIYGPREFLAFYVVAGVAGYVGDFVAHGSGLVVSSTALGASGAVTAAFVLFAFHYPRQEVRLFFVLPMPVWALAVGYILLDTFGAVGTLRGNTAYVVHLAGALFGYLYYNGQWRITGGRTIRRPAVERRERPRLRVLPADEVDRNDDPEPIDRSARRPAPAEQLETKLDSVLEKVSKFGQAGLSADEREILFRASEIYKNRRK